MLDPYSLLFWFIWSSWMAFWYVSSRHVKRAVRTESRAARLGHSIPMVISAALVAIPALPGAPRWLFAEWLPRGLGRYGVGLALAALGECCAVWARLVLGRNWSGTVTVKHDHDLVTAGPYRWVRHPIYTGLLLGFTGTALALGQVRGLLAVLIAVLALVRKLRIEERWMRETFGQGYAEYRERTPGALVPWLL